MTYTYIQPPFSLESLDREKFTPEAEAASIFCLAEERRKRKGFLGGTEEKMTSLLKINYPIYAIRWRDRSILLDGLGSVFEYVIYRDLIDIKKFLNDLSKASEGVGQLRAFLTKNDHTFRDFKSSRRMKMNNIISNIMLLSELTDYLKKSPSTKPTRETSVCFRVDKQTVKQIISEFDTLVKQIEQDVDSLERVEKALRSSVDQSKQKILDDRAQESEKYRQELDRLKPIVDKKIEDLHRQQDEAIRGFLNSIEEESEEIREEKTRCEREVKRLTLVQKECLEEKKASTQRADRVGEEYWNEQAEMLKAQIADLWKTIKDCADRLEKLQFKSDARVKHLKDRYEKQIRDAEAKFEEKEFSRDSSATIKDFIIKELEHRYSLISSQISRLIGEKRKERNRLLDMTSSWAPKSDSVILVPLYLVKYESEGQGRYNVYAPAMANSYAVFKKTFGRTFRGLESKISRLLTPIGREFEKFFAHGFLKLLTSNRRFESAVLEAAVGTNLFEDPNRGGIFRTGLAFLKDEGWLTESEYQRMLRSLNLSFKTVSAAKDNLKDQTLK